MQGERGRRGTQGGKGTRLGWATMRRWGEGEGGGRGKGPLTIPLPRIPAVIIYSATFSKDDRKDWFLLFCILF